jgi:hypothetical protein
VDSATLLRKLKDLWDTKWLLEKNGPNSNPGAEWLAEVRAHLQLANPKLAAEFAHYMQYVGLRLSSHMLSPIWINMQGILRTAIATVEATLPPGQEKIYGPGDAMDLYRDLSEIVATAADEVFIADPYADQEIFDLYLAKLSPKTRIRLLTKPPSSALKTLVGKFLARPGAVIEARSSTTIHDRVIFIDCRECWVIGQSIKDAAMKKPTYLLPVAAVSDMQRLYEDAWSNATPY